MGRRAKDRSTLVQPSGSNTKKIVGSAYEQLIDLISGYAKNDYPVLFVGERGTGKELFSEHYMASSKRKGKNQTRNCASFSDELLRSEIFGHKQGAFTGAKKDREGLIKSCSGGIVFLDELGDASEQFQAAILRVAEKNSFSSIGSDHEERSDVVIVAATNKPTRVRPDLQDRFNVLPVPPLQKSDIPALAEHFLGRPFSSGVLAELMSRDYPGNVRELMKTCQQLFVERGDTIFDKSRYAAAKSAGVFDYTRFRREIEVWNRHLAPLIEKTGLPFRYFYFSVSDASVESISSMSENGLPHYLEGHYPTIAWMVRDYARLGFNRYFSDVSIEEFSKRLEKVFATGDLPVFLAAVASLSKRSEWYPLQLMTSLSPLLDITSPRRAMNRFQSAYLEHQLAKNNNDVTKTAESLGLKPASLKQKLKRLKNSSQ